MAENAETARERIRRLVDDRLRASEKVQLGVHAAQIANNPVFRPWFLRQVDACFTQILEGPAEKVVEWRDRMNTLIQFELDLLRDMNQGEHEADRLARTPAPQA